MAFGRLVSLFRKSPFMQGPLLSRVGVIQLAITPVLILLLWRFHSPSMMDADVRGAVILNDPLTTQESGFHPVVFDVDGNPRGTQSLAHVPQGSPNAGRLHRGDHVTLLCESRPCEVVQIRQGDQVLVSGEALAEYSRYKNRLSALGLLVWALCGAGLIWLSGRRRYAAISGRGTGRRRRRSRSSGSSRPAGSSRSSGSSRRGGASRSSGSSRSGGSSRSSGSAGSGGSSRSSGSSRRGGSSRSSGSSRPAESSRSSGASRPAESSRSSGSSRSSSGASGSSTGTSRSSGTSRPAEVPSSSPDTSQPSGQSGRSTSSDNE